jgi:L-fuculose-phosphate aldolase
MTDALREKLVDAGRVLVSEDQGDYVAGHVTLRLPGGDGRFLMKPAGIGLEEMTPDGIITVDREGERIDGTMPAQRGVHSFGNLARAIRHCSRCSYPPAARRGVLIARAAAVAGRQ